MKKQIILLISVVCAVMATVSCHREKTISFDTREPDALIPGLEWAVISEPYAGYRTQAGYENPVSEEGRRGDILLVKGKQLVQNKKGSPSPVTAWYQFENGWLEESVVNLYDNKLKAQTAASKLQK